MNNQILFIYELPFLFNIFEEIKENLNFQIINLTKKEITKTNFSQYENYLILSQKKNLNLSNVILVDDFPIKFSMVLEKINIGFLKKKFNEQSNIIVGQYTININSREIILDDQRLKLTEKEINTIIYLSKKKKPVSVQELQEKVWAYQSKLETHTVETHIHRLRKKFKEKFLDDKLIISKDNGYQISEKKIDLQKNFLQKNTNQE